MMRAGQNGRGDDGSALLDLYVPKISLVYVVAVVPIRSSRNW